MKRHSKIPCQMTLKRETIRKLLDQDLQAVVGGSQNGEDDDPDPQRKIVMSKAPICH